MPGLTNQRSPPIGSPTTSTKQRAIHVSLRTIDTPLLGRPTPQFGWPTSVSMLTHCCGNRRTVAAATTSRQRQARTVPQPMPSHHRPAVEGVECPPTVATATALVATLTLLLLLLPRLIFPVHQTVQESPKRSHNRTGMMSSGSIHPGRRRST